MNNNGLITGLIILVVIIFVAGGIVAYTLVGSNSKDSGDSNTDEPIIIGGCAGVSLEYRQECCDNWAEENGIFVAQCVGEWTINEENQCAWECYEE